MEKQNSPEKPFSLKYDEAENGIFCAVTEAARQIPFYLIEGMLTNILHQVREKARIERDTEKALFEKQLKEFNETEEEKCTET